MKRILSFLSICLLSLTAVTAAFDGERKGLVLGMGFGISPSTHWSTDYMGRHISENKVAFGQQILVGYGLNEKNVLALEINLTSFRSDIYDYRLIQGFGGVSWYHYFGPQDHSLFTIAGLGVYRFVSSWGIYIHISFDGFDDTPPLPDGATGLGFLLGGGYELSHHVQAAVYFSAGETSERWAKYSNSHINLLLTGTLF